MHDAVNTLKSLKRLARGMLRQALDDLNFDPDTEELELYIETTRGEARAWFQDDSKVWGSFNHVCTILQRDPDKIRKRLDLSGD